MVLDAVAVAVATAAAFVFRAGVRDYDSLGPGHLASLILPALVFVSPFRCRAVERGWVRIPRRAALDLFFVVASGLAWAAVPLAFVAVYWGRGPEAPMIVMAVGYPAAVTCVVAGRHLLDAGRPWRCALTAGATAQDRLLFYERFADEFDARMNRYEVTSGCV